MLTALTYAEAKEILSTIAMAQPRLLGAILLIPLFSQKTLPGMLRYTFTVSLGFLLVPVLQPQMPTQVELGFLAVVVVKEVFVGACLGFLIAIPFWIMDGVGTLIDTQRGASMGAMLNPELGTESTPMGLLFSMAYGVLFLIGGGFLASLSMIYDSFALWPVWQWTPTLSSSSVPLWLAQMDHVLRAVMLFSLPAVIAMLLAEVGLALVSRFTPQLQVFFLAMPIKSGLALFVLVLYIGLLFHYATGESLGTQERFFFLKNVLGGH